MSYVEVNFDGLVGPTHNFAGLSEGNIASIASRESVSHPREAALQGLRKMKTLADLGLAQAVLPPLERPSVNWLRTFGITGENDAAILARAAQDAPWLLAACSSASAMWTANAATMTPSCDSTTGRAHFSVANLGSKLHRAIEAPETQRTLERIFASPEHFVVHSPLGGGEAMRDEGAANHTRLAAAPGDAGTHVFVYGATLSGSGQSGPQRFPARQTLEASQAIARRHGIPAERAVFVQQNPDAIDAGVFHNDVIAVGHQNVLLYHELAFAAGPEALDRIAAASETGLIFIPCPSEAVCLHDAVKSYVFNSQLVSLPDGRMALIAPQESADNPATARFIEQMVAAPTNPVDAVKFLDLRQSMRNGGGPACLRLRVVLNAAERSALAGRVWLDDALHADLERWITRHYRETLTFRDLADPALLTEVRTALDELTQVLQLGSLYPFQNQ